MRVLPNALSPSLKERVRAQRDALQMMCYKHTHRGTHILHITTTSGAINSAASRSTRKWLVVDGHRRCCCYCIGQSNCHSRTWMYWVQKRCWWNTDSFVICRRFTSNRCFVIRRFAEHCLLLNLEWVATLNRDGYDMDVGLGTARYILHQQYTENQWCLSRTAKTEAAMVVDSCVKIGQPSWGRKKYYISPTWLVVESLGRTVSQRQRAIQIHNAPATTHPTPKYRTGAK